MAKTKYMTMDEIANVLLQNEEAVEYNFAHQEILEDICYEICCYEDNDNNELFNIMQNVNCKKINYKQLVLQFKQALSDKTPEAKEFINNINLFLKPFSTANNGDYKILLKKVHNEKLKYAILQEWRYLAMERDYDEDDLKLLKLRAQNPYASSDSIFEFYLYDDRLGKMGLTSDIFKRGLKKFDEELIKEANKDKPDFNMGAKWFHFSLIKEKIEEDLFNYEESVEFISKYGDEAIDMRIRILMLEKENKELKAELKKKKTNKFKAGIDNVVKKSGTTKPIISKSKMR